MILATMNHSFCCAYTSGWRGSASFVMFEIIIIIKTAIQLGYWHIYKEIKSLPSLTCSWFRTTLSW